jgi:lipopolysaccharide transport system ATP-binding protein
LSTTVVTAAHIGKRYRLGELRGGATLREALGARFGRYIGIKRVAAAQEFWALKDVSFDIKQGETVGIIGRNGAGKSTLLKIFSRITPPTEGQVRLRGRVSSLLEVGTGFHGDLTGRENIYLNGAILGMQRAEIRRKFDEIVSFAEVERFLDTPVKRYSSGMYVRLAFSVAAHLESDILIVDEVLAVGDMKFQRKCLAQMQDVARAGRTVVFVSHNMAAVATLCERGIVVDRGRVVLDGAAGEAIRNYVDRMVEHGGEVVWPEVQTAPGDQIVRLRAVRILQDRGDRTTENVFISKPVILRIEYDCLHDGARLYAAFWLRDRMNVDVLCSSTAHGMTIVQDKWYGKPHPCGRFVSECELPADFLNDGLYYVTPILGVVPSQTKVLVENALAFNVVEDGSMREELTGHLIGCVRPRLAWRTWAE